MQEMGMIALYQAAKMWKDTIGLLKCKYLHEADFTFLSVKDLGGDRITEGNLKGNLRARNAPVMFLKGWGGATETNLLWS